MENPPKDQVWHQVVMHVAEGKLTTMQIAEKCGISARTIRYWKAEPEFQECVSEILQEWRSRLKEYGIANKLHRLRDLEALRDRIKSLIEARAADPKMAGVAGGESGLLIRRIKAVAGKAVAEYETDTGVISALTLVLRQAAGETGQFAEKDDWSRPDGGEALFDMTLLTDQELDLLERLYEAATKKKLGTVLNLAPSPDADPKPENPGDPDPDPNA